MKKKIIGLVGYGIVGKAHEVAFSNHCQVWINDPEFKDLENYLPKYALMSHCEAIFVGVPTPYDPKTNTFTADIIYKVFEELAAAKHSTKNPVIVLKSAVLPTVVMELEKKHPELRIVVSPEYLSERNSIADLLAQETLILGGKKEDRDLVINLYFNHSSCNKKATIGAGDNAAQIALIKYMENSFLALKVVFMNEFKLLHDKMFNTTDDAKFNEIIKIHQLDTRMGGPYPYCIPGPDGHLGFGGKCLPKDLLSIIAEAKEHDISMDILKTTWKKNLAVRDDRNWTEIKGAIE